MELAVGGNDRAIKDGEDLAVHSSHSSARLLGNLHDNRKPSLESPLNSGPDWSIVDFLGNRVGS